MHFRKLLAALGIAFLLASAGCATKSVRDVAAEEGVKASPELIYFGAIEDYKQAKLDAIKYVMLISTPPSEAVAILRVINGGTSDRGCNLQSVEPRCLDGIDGTIRSFEKLRRLGGTSPDKFQAISFSLATAAAQIRAAQGE